MKREFFTAKTLDELKKEYRTLAKKWHPDCGGDLVTMQRINAEYDELSFMLARSEARGDTQEQRDDNAAKAWDAAQGMKETIQKILNCVGLNIEICGTWLWVSGLTYCYRDQLKAAGFSWASAKKEWYWHPGEWVPARKSHMSMDQIRAKYGSVLIQTDAQPSLAAAM